MFILMKNNFRKKYSTVVSIPAGSGSGDSAACGLVRSLEKTGGPSTLLENRDHFHGSIRNRVDGESIPACLPSIRFRMRRFARTGFIPQPAIPVRICPHCGYEIRTWSRGNVSCTRCENDIGTGEAAGNIPETCREMGMPMEC